MMIAMLLATIGRLEKEEEDIKMVEVKRSKKKVEKVKMARR